MTSHVLDGVREWLGRYVLTVNDSDLDLLTLWAAHTHLVNETYSSPRLLLDSPMPGSGKTTCLEHLARLCVSPVQMAAVSSSALLVRLLQDKEGNPLMRTLLIDEVDRTLRPDKETTPDLIAILNSGYKRGATRPVLVPVKGGGWESQEMPTFAPVAMAGNSPQLPDDTRTRTIRVLLLPDHSGIVEESDWELIERLHGAAAPQVQAAAQRRLDYAAAQDAAERLGILIETSPQQALLDELARSAGALAFYQARLDEADDPNGLLVRTMFGSTPSTWLQLWNDERDRMARISTAALKAGIEERRVQLAEAQGALIADAIRRILNRLNLTHEQLTLVGTVVPEELRALTA